MKVPDAGLAAAILKRVESLEKSVKLQSDVLEQMRISISALDEILGNVRKTLMELCQVATGK